jgi:peptide/nickel transport system substrate-binding protein
MILKTMVTAVATATVAMLALSACGGGGGGVDGEDDASQNDETARGGTLTLGAVVAPTTLDPAGAEWGNRSLYYQAVYDTLLLATPEGTIEPWLATDWSWDETSTELTLTLREDVTFSDGAPLDADAVVANMEHFRVGGGPDQGYMMNVADITAADASTVVVGFSAPDPAFLNYLTRTAGLVASPESLESDDLPTTPVGSGPYLLDTSSTVTDSTYVYTRNPDYWNPDVQHYDRLVINVLADPTAALNAIQAGEANGVKLASNDNLAQVESAGWTVHANELDFQGLLLLDRAGSMSEPLSDVRVRQAINYAVDREAMLEVLQDGYGSVTTQVFPARSAAYDEGLDDRYPFDPDRARELMAEAGYADGFTIEMPSTPVLSAATYALIGQQLSDIGITVQHTDPGTNFIADLLAPRFAASFMSLEQNPDWQLIQFMISPTAVFNPFRYSDPEADRMIAEIQTGDEATQESVVRELNEYLVEEAWFAPFYRVQNSYATDRSTDVKMLPSNVSPNVYDFVPVD